MAYVVSRNNGAWEIRESRVSAGGPRSHTLATFRVLTAEIVERASARAAKPLPAGELRRAAVRAGAPIAADPSDRAAGELLAELTRGRWPRRALRELLLATLQGKDGDTSSAGAAAGPSANARAAGAWVAASTVERGEALRDLLLLSDRLPVPGARAARRFPRIDTAMA